jgi:chromosome segregation ATPase
MQFVKFIVLALSTSVLAEKVSPVQKVVELLEECKAKVAKDLAADASAMAEFTTFCDEELKSKGYAIQTAAREIGDLDATIADSMATVMSTSDEIQELGSLASAKDKELYDATEVRNAKRADFEAAEKELVTSVDECSRAVAALNKGFTFMQTKQRKEAKKEMEAVKSALSSVINAISIDTESTRKLKSFLQSVSTDNDDLSLRQPQAKQIAYESKTGGIIQTVKDMQAKAETELSDLRKKETTEAHEFNMLEQNLQAEMSHTQDKLSNAKKAKGSATETQAKAEEDLTATKANKAADEEASATLKSECTLASEEWAAREASAKEEMAAIDKAKEILLGGVVAFAQMSSKLHLKSRDDADDSDASSEVRTKLVSKIQSLGKKTPQLWFDAACYCRLVGSFCEDSGSH